MGTDTSAGKTPLLYIVFCTVEAQGRSMARDQTAGI